MIVPTGLSERTSAMSQSCQKVAVDMRPWTLYTHLGRSTLGFVHHASCLRLRGWLSVAVGWRRPIRRSAYQLVTAELRRGGARGAPTEIPRRSESGLQAIHFIAEVPPQPIRRRLTVRTSLRSIATPLLRGGDFTRTIRTDYILSAHALRHLSYCPRRLQRPPFYQVPPSRHN